MDELSTFVLYSTDGPYGDDVDVLVDAEYIRHETYPCIIA
jgi:hypothetical protein